MNYLTKPACYRTFFVILFSKTLGVVVFKCDYTEHCNVALIITNLQPNHVSLPHALSIIEISVAYFVIFVSKYYKIYIFLRQLYKKGSMSKETKYWQFQYKQISKPELGHMCK